MTVVLAGSFAPNLTNDAEFRALGKMMSDGFAAVGLVKTADTGQINWTTVAKPASNVSAGYEIWRFVDTAQATQPLFFKFEWGIGSGATSPNWWITVGTGSDGAGGITGIRLTRSTIGRGTSSTLFGDTFIAAGDGYFVMNAFAAPATAGVHCFVGIERLRNADGSVDTTPATAGLTCFLTGTSYALYNSYLYDNSMFDTPGSSETPWPALTPWTLSGTVSANYKGQIYAAPLYPMVGPVARAPMRSAILVGTGDVSAGQLFSITLYGSTHQFRGSSFVNTRVSSGGGYNVAIRAE